MHPYTLFCMLSSLVPCFFQLQNLIIISLLLLAYFLAQSLATFLHTSLSFSRLRFMHTFMLVPCYFSLVLFVQFLFIFLSDSPVSRLLSLHTFSPSSLQPFSHTVKTNSWLLFFPPFSLVPSYFTCIPSGLANSCLSLKSLLPSSLPLLLHTFLPTSWLLFLHALLPSCLLLYKHAFLHNSLLLSMLTFFLAPQYFSCTFPSLNFCYFSACCLSQSCLNTCDSCRVQGSEEPCSLVDCHTPSVIRSINYIPGDLRPQVHPCYQL